MYYLLSHLTYQRMQSPFKKCPATSRHRQGLLACGDQSPAHVASQRPAPYDPTQDGLPRPGPPRLTRGLCIRVSEKRGHGPRETRAPRNTCPPDSHRLSGFASGRKPLPPVFTSVCSDEGLLIWTVTTRPGEGTVSQGGRCAWAALNPASRSTPQFHSARLGPASVRVHTCARACERRAGTRGSLPLAAGASSKAVGSGATRARSPAPRQREASPRGVGSPPGPGNPAPLAIGRHPQTPRERGGVRGSGPPVPRSGPPARPGSVSRLSSQTRRQQVLAVRGARGAGRVSLFNAEPIASRRSSRTV